MQEIVAVVFLTLAATLRVATPLILCAMGGLFSERSGIIDVGLEGKMLMAAFFAAATSSVTGSAWLGVAAGIAAAEALALLHGFACITHRGNQVVSGVAINILASGLTVVFDNMMDGTACVTDDGVILHGAASGEAPGGIAGTGSIQALSVHYSAQPDDVFTIPAGYHAMAMPTQRPDARSL